MTHMLRSQSILGGSNLKTNHRRSFIERDRRRVTNFSGKVITMDGGLVSASSSICHFSVRGIHGLAKDRRGAKKFLNSRRRRRDRDTINSIIKGDMDG